MFCSLSKANIQEEMLIVTKSRMFHQIFCDLKLYCIMFKSSIHPDNIVLIMNLARWRSCNTKLVTNIAQLWLCYVEKNILSRLTNSQKKKLLWMTHTLSLKRMLENKLRAWVLTYFMLIWFLFLITHMRYTVPAYWSQVENEFIPNWKNSSNILYIIK